jgi:hypothetical protein
MQSSRYSLSSSKDRYPRPVLPRSALILWTCEWRCQQAWDYLPPMTGRVPTAKPGGIRNAGGQRG